MCNSCSFAIVAIDLWHVALSWWKSSFFFFCGRFWQFLPSNASIMLYNICYWWFFLSQGNQWTKYLAHSKIRKPKACLLMFASLVTLDGFHLLLSTQLTADLTLEWSGGSMFHPLLHIYAKLLFVTLKQLQSMLWIVNVLLFFIDYEQMRHTLWTQLSHWQIFMQNGEYTAFWYLQSYSTSIYNRPKRACRVFFVFSKTTAKFCVCTTAFKVSIPLLNCCFWWSRVRITLIKPLRCLNSIFSHQKAMLYQHMKFRFFHCFENLPQ